MKIYVASAFANKDEAREVMAILRAIGHEITHDWTEKELDTSWPKYTQDNYLLECGVRDWEGVMSADALVLVNHEKCRDAMAEFGMAIGAGKPAIVYHSERRGSVFYGVDLVWRADSLPALLEIVTGIALRAVRADKKRSA